MKSTNSDLFSYALVLYAVGAVAAIVLPLQLNEGTGTETALESKSPDAELKKDVAAATGAQLADCDTGIAAVTAELGDSSKPIVSAAVDTKAAQPCAPATTTVSKDLTAPADERTPVITPAVVEQPVNQAL